MTNLGLLWTVIIVYGVAGITSGLLGIWLTKESKRKIITYRESSLAFNKPERRKPRRREKVCVLKE